MYNSLSQARKVAAMRGLMAGPTDADFERQYGSEAQCFEALLQARRQAGMPCPRCENPRFYLCGRRVGCSRCNRRWTITAGTIMAAWYLHKRLRHAMTERESHYLLGNLPQTGGAAPVVEADDEYLGGERNEGSGPAGKTPMIAAAERLPIGGMGHVAMQVVAGFTSAAIKTFKTARIAPNAVVHTDGLRAFMAFDDDKRTHLRTCTGSTRPPRKRGEAFFLVNTAIANLSTAINATHKAISAKHTQDYLGAFCWTTNRRRNMAGMVPALCRAIATSTRLTRSGVYAQIVSLG